jgi:hypothetical protein
MAIVMRYLTLTADYQQLSIRDKHSGAVDVATLGLPDELVTELVAWNDGYQQVVLSEAEKRSVEPLASLIRELDRSGLALAERVAAAVDGGAKVTYYSEGLLRPLP